jgi:hypothetical protein
MGAQGYDELVVRCDAHLAAVQAARKSRSAGPRKLLPLMVHPATLAAEQAARGATSRTSAKSSGAR